MPTRRGRLEREIAQIRSGSRTRATSHSAASTPFEEAKAEEALIEKEVDAASEALQAFPRGAMGLIPDVVTSTPEYQAANTRFQKAFARQRAFNAVFTKKFAKELRAERTKRYAELTLASRRAHRHLLAANQRVVVESDGGRDAMTWADFADANREMPELVDVADELRRNGRATIGGGAAPFVTVRIAD